MTAQERMIVMTGAQIAEAVRGETAKNKTRVAFRHDFEHCRCGDRSGNLERDVGNNITERGPPPGPYADRDRWVEVSAGNMSNGIGHCQLR